MKYQLLSRPQPNHHVAASAKKTLALLVALTSLLCLSPKASAQVTYALTNVWYVPTNLPAANNIIIAGDQNRSLAYDINSNQVFVAAKAGASPAPGIEVLDAATGNYLGMLDKTVVSGGAFVLNQVKVAADGAIYAANLVNPGTPASITKIYRWTNWLSLATVAFAGNSLSNVATLFGLPASPGQRVGDSMAITGSGTSTKILMPVSSGSPTLTTNMIMFTTADGLTFTNHIVALGGFTSAGGSGICGVSFYTNNTFLIRISGSAGNNVFLFQFPANIAALDAGPIAATQIGSFLLPGVLSTSAFIDYESSIQGGLMAVVSPQNSGGAGASTQVALYSDPVVGNTSCSLQQASTNYPHLVTNGNLAGAAALGGVGYSQFVYSLDCNNGVRCSGITTIAAQGPSITTQPVGGTVYPPYTLTVSAGGFCPLIYQWQATNNAGSFTNIPGATSSSYTISLPSTNSYRVVITNTVNLTTSAVAQVISLSAITNSSVTQLWRVAPNQSGYSYLTTSDNTRGIAYDTNTHRVVVASATGLFILNGDNGTNVASLSLTGVAFGGLLGGADQVGIADDGAVYSGNVNNGAFVLYRWNAPTNTATAVSAYNGDPGSGSNDRWGDYLSVRGAGIGTQILLASKATNIVILTTTDGTNFTANRIAITNATTGFAASGIVFGAGNTFWAKSGGGNLWQIAYDPVNQVGGVLFNYAAGTQIPSSMIGVGVDPILNLLAGVVTSDNPDDLQLFQLTGSADAPVLFQQSFFAANNVNGNGNATIAMKGGRIYGLDVNNGLLALSYGAPAGTPPLIVTPPASQTAYTNIPVLTFSVNVSGSLPLLYQWRFNSNNISGATSRNYSLTNPPLSTAGYYDVIVRNVSGVVTSTPPALLTLLTPVTSSVVTQLWSLAAGSRAYLDGSTYNTRGLAYDTNTGTLLIADHANIYLLAATNGSDLGNLNTAGLPNQGVNGWVVDQLGVADDGILYSCNLSLTGPEFSILQWSSLAPGAAATGYAFGNGTGADPSGTGDRWGDTMSVRGAGVNTEIICGSDNGTTAVVFDTADGMIFTPHPISVAAAPPGFSGLGIAFGAGNTFWAKGGHNYNLRQVAYDKGTGLGTVTQVYTAGIQVPNDLTGLSVDVANNILGGVCFNDTPHDFQLYLLSGNTNPPALFEQAFFGSFNANVQEDAVSILKGGLGFALDVNNGVVALTYGVPLAPSFTITSVTYQIGTGTTLTWPTFNGRTYQVEYKNALTDSSWTPVGAPIVATGATLSYTDSSATGVARFYHVKVQ